MFFFLLIRYRAFIATSEVSPLTATLPALFAKSSLVLPAFLTLVGNSNVRTKICCYDKYLREKNRRSIV